MAVKSIKANQSKTVSRNGKRIPAEQSKTAPKKPKPPKEGTPNGQKPKGGKGNSKPEKAGVLRRPKTKPAKDTEGAEGAEDTEGAGDLPADATDREYQYVNEPVERLATLEKHGSQVVSDGAIACLKRAGIDHIRDMNNLDLPGLSAADSKAIETAIGMLMKAEQAKQPEPAAV